MKRGIYRRGEFIGDLALKSAKDCIYPCGTTLGIMPSEEKTGILEGSSRFLCPETRMKPVHCSTSRVLQVSSGLSHCHDNWRQMQQVDA